MKRLIATLLIAPISLMADTWIDPSTEIEWTYTVENGEASLGAEIYNQYAGILYLSAVSPIVVSGNVEIPSFLGGLPVTCIGARAFSGLSKLTGVKIPSSVSHIESEAFASCSGLSAIEIPSGVVSIGEKSFNNCGGLKSVTIHSGVSSIGNNAFEWCLGLKSLLIPSSVEHIGDRAFNYCQGLTSLELQSGIKTIGNFSFSFCDKLGYVKIPSSVSSIGTGAFELCTGITSIEIQPGVESIGDSAFQGCSALTAVTIPVGVTSIGSGAFSSCSSLAYLEMPASVTIVGDSAFFGCDALKSLNVPSSVSSIGKYAFSHCGLLTSITIPQSVVSIGVHAFSDDERLTQVYVTKGDVDRVKGLYGWPSNVSFVEIQAPTPTIVCNVVFDATGGNSVQNIEVTKGEAIGELSTPTRTGYQFDGWYTKKSGGTKVTTDTKVTADVTYYAHWTSLMKPGSCPSAAVALTLSSKRQTVSTTLVTPFDDGESWYESDGAYFYKFTPKRGEGFSMCIPYDSRYWDGGDYLAPDFFVGSLDEDADVPEVMFYEGFASSSNMCYIEPDAWNDCTESSATYIVYVFGGYGRKFSLSSKLISGYSDVVFDCNGGSMTFGDDDLCVDLNLLLEVGGTIDSGLKDCLGSSNPVYSKYKSLDSWKPTRSQYAFAGWFTEAEGGTKVTGKTIVPDADGGVTYYAHWTYDGSAYVGVVVSDECEGMGTVSGGNKSFKSGAKVSLKATAKKGYVFAGWYLDDAIETIASTCVSQSPSYTYIATGEEDTTIYAKFIATEDDWVSVDCAAEEEYAKGEAMTPIEIAVDSGSLATVKVTGLPTGIKFTAKALSVKATKTTDAAEYAANTIYGKPTKSGVYTATVTATTAGKATATKTLKFIVRGEGEGIVDAAWETNKGKVTGMGVCATGKAITLKAVANTGYVFGGWYTSAGVFGCGDDYDGSWGFANPVEETADYRSPTLVVRCDGTDKIVCACFISVEQDRMSISASVGDEFWFDAESATAEKTISAGVYLEWPVAAEALSATTIKVTGLPTGLKFTAKDITQKIGTGKTAETVVVVPANTIYGTPSAASKKVKVEGEEWTVTPSQVKITVTTTGKNAQTFQIDTTVVALPEQVVGTFTGGSCDDPSGSATLTVAASGKVSGKWISEGKTWTLAATGFTSGEPDGYQFDTTLTAKCGKETQEIPLTVTSDGVASCDLFSAYWANWKIEPWKTLGKVMANKKYVFYIDADGNTSEDAIDSPYGTVTLTMSANGTVKTAGSFITGTNAKTGKDIVYNASESTILIPECETTYRILVYFPPKGVFVGYAKELTLEWNGYAFGGPESNPEPYPAIDPIYHLCKPVVYLYPETNTTCRVTVKLDGKLTYTYPDYGANGWTNFVASPDGTLTFADGSQYYCLFWEGVSDCAWDFSQGYCVKGSETVAFLADILLQMGLSFREANEFIIYWLPLMQDNPYNIIAFQGENYTNVARLTVEPQPESVLRVFMAWKPSARAVDIPVPVITPFERKGFTVVEWGGTKVQ